MEKNKNKYRLTTTYRGVEILPSPLPSSQDQNNLKMSETNKSSLAHILPKYLEYYIKSIWIKAYIYKSMK